jgi:hypothetical protein
VPYSTNASLKMVAAWVYMYDDPTKSLWLGLVMKAIIMACRAEVVVELLASRSIWHWIELHAQNASHLLRFLFKPGGLGYTKRYLGVMQSVADVLQQIEHVMFGFELYLWCTENAKAHHKITSVVRVCDDAVRAVDAAEVFLRRRSSLDEGTRRTIYICRFVFSYVVATLHLIDTDKVSPMIGRLCPSVVAKIQEFARDDKHPFLRAVLHGFHTPWRQRCYGPDCLRTCASQNTEFMACVGCTRAVYCSRRCQKAAWKYDKAPHREVCRVYRHLHLTEKQAKENGARMDAMIGVLVTALVDYLPPISLSERNFEAADAICRNFNRIAMAKFMHTSEHVSARI